MTPDIIIWIAFALAQIADVLTTRRLLDQGGRELNPVVAFFMGRMGRQWWIAKIAIAWAGAAALHWFGYTWVVAILAGVIGAVALNNWRQIE